MLSSPTNLGLNPGGRDVLAPEPQQLDIIAVDIRSAEVNYRSHEGGYPDLSITPFNPRWRPAIPEREDDRPGFA
jgi:hypothetical protein